MEGTTTNHYYIITMVQNKVITFNTKQTMQNTIEIKRDQETNGEQPKLITMGGACKELDIDKSPHNILYLKEVVRIRTERKQLLINLISRESTKYHTPILYNISLSLTVFYIFLCLNKTSLPFNLIYKGGDYYG